MNTEMIVIMMSKIIIFVMMIYILREINHAFNVSFENNYINVNR